MTILEEAIFYMCIITVIVGTFTVLVLIADVLERLFSKISKRWRQ